MSVVPLPKAAERLQNLGHLQDIPAVRQLGVLLAAAGAIALGLWLFFWTQSPSLVPLLPGSDAQTVAEASTLLGSSGVDFEVDAGGNLSVPQDQLARARMALASAGLPAKASGGFELLNGDQGFGTSQFIENARYQHALETELARSIGNLQPVREARVHLGIPKPSAFTRERQPARASIVLQLRTGTRLEPGQAESIVYLVSSSIPNLAPENVTVVDQSGRLLTGSRNADEDEQGARQLAQRRRQEAVYVTRIQELLEPMTGPGRVSAQVSVEMDFSQHEEARELYGEPGHVRSEQLSEVTSGEETVAAQGVPGANANTPDPVGTTAGEAVATTGPASRSEVRNYELDRTLTHTRRTAGQITRVNAAVLVDHIPTPPGEDGEPATRPLTEQEVAHVQTLVREAVGFDAARGDSVSVVNARFIPREVPAPEEIPFWQTPGFADVLRLLVGGLAVLLVIWTVVRPTFRQLVAPRRPGTRVAAVAGDEEIPTLVPQPPEDDLLLPEPDRAADRARRIASLDEKLEVARGAVQSDPKRVAGLVRNMMTSPHV